MIGRLWVISATSHTPTVCADVQVSRLDSMAVQLASVLLFSFYLSHMGKRDSHFHASFLYGYLSGSYLTIPVSRTFTTSLGYLPLISLL